MAPAATVPVVLMKSRLLIVHLSIFRNEIVNFNYNIKEFDINKTSNERREAENARSKKREARSK